MLWVVDYLEEVDADFRVFYRYPQQPDAPGIADGDYGAFSGPQILRLAWRLASYQGAVAAKILYDKEKEKKERAPKSALIKEGTQYTEQTFEETMKDNPGLIEYEKV